MIHVVTQPATPETIQAMRADEREAIIRYGEAIAAEQGARRVLECWRGLYDRCRDRLDHMSRADAASLADALQQRTHAAIEAHTAAAAELNRTPSPFGILLEAISKAIGT